MRERFAIRQPTAADAGAIASVHVDGWRDTYGHLLPERFYDHKVLAQRTAMWTSLLSRIVVPPRLFVADSDGQVVGFAYAGPSEEPDSVRALTLHSLYVRSQLHGRGIGQGLLEAAVHDDPTQLWVAKDNSRARTFYCRNGFVLDGNEKIDHDADDLVEVRLVR